ncbi:tetratricopeptide repeat protein [Actinacidiphila sp. bgisy145]|uniref:tetratricopeptide repeat protein n=1 Tax=Actinacidiphila sp. bgisy145 TaxID=3413792 RepID=UPI003EBAC6FA
MADTRSALRGADRAEVERLLRRAAAGAAGDRRGLLARGRKELDTLAAAAPAEYAAYRTALREGRAASHVSAAAPGSVPGLAAITAAVAAFCVDLAHGLSAGAAVTTALVAAAATFAVAALRTLRAHQALPAGAAQARAAWLAAVEERAIGPFVRQAQAPPAAKAAAPKRPQPAAPAPVPPPPPEPAADHRAPAPPPPRAAERPPVAKTRRGGGDRSAAARTRAVLEQSFQQLPEAEGPFAGRRAHLARIAQWVHQSRASTAVRPTVVVLHGPAGGGRTSLAVRAARELRDQFKGACVVDLRGAGPSPLPVRDALLHLLNRLGAPRDQLLFRERPERQDHGQHLTRLAEQYQQHLTGVPVVIVLDDATDAEQVRPLVPERSESLVLVTAAEPFDPDVPGAVVHHLPVGPLDLDDTFELLGEIADAAGTDTAPPEQAERLRALTAGLPIALRIAGSGLAAHGGAARLADDIEVFGPRDPVDRVLALRYHDQPEPGRRLLRRLALAGRASFGAAAAAALLATDEQEAGRRLAELAAAGLLENVRGSRYRPHDLVRAFAAERLLDEEDPVERAAAHERLIRSYADLADTVIRLVEGKTSTRAGRFGPHGFASLDLALRWLDEESSFITAALRDTAGVDQAAVQALLGALCDYCLLRGDLYRLGEISEMAQAQQAAGGRSGPEGDRSVLVRSVQWRTGIAARQLGELDRSKSTLSAVVDLYFEAEHPAGAARALDSLGITLHHQGNLKEAELRLREAVDIQGAPGLEEDRAWTLHALGAVLRDRDEVAQALALLEESLALHRENESVQGEAWAHLQLGQVQLRLGRLDEGEEELRAAGRCYALARDPRGTAWTLTQLARARLMRGQAREAAHDLDEAVQRHRATEDARGEAWTLYYLGHALEESGDTDAALRTLERARSMFSRMRDVYGLACARHHSARVTRDQRAARTGNLRNSGFARQLLQDARQDFRRIGVAHGEAWSCVELAVIDAGNGRLLEALSLLDEAGGLFAGLGDRRGHDWAVFLRATVLPLLAPDPAGPDGAARADEELRALLAASFPERDPDLAEYAEAYRLLLARGSIVPGSPWNAWELGMTPTRSARMVMAVPT